jgi:uncharacterized membrane protein YhaH (DUF805 family)
MTTVPSSEALSPLQSRIKAFCVWIETKFECRMARAPFGLRLVLAAAVFYALYQLQNRWLVDARWPLWAFSWILFAGTAFWVVLQIVRRFHDLGRTGGLFWVLAVPFWAFWKLSGLFPGLWLVWMLLCLWPIWLALQLVFKRGTKGPNGYEGRS